MKSFLSLCALAAIGLAGCSGAESAERTERAGAAAEAEIADSAGLALDAKLPFGFGQVSNVVELDGDRVAFADTREKLFLTGSFRSGKLDTLGVAAAFAGSGKK